MKLFITLEESIVDNIASYLQSEKTLNFEQADVSIIFFANPAGGVDDPSPYIKRPQTTGVIAGPPTEESKRFASIAESMGIASENILFTATDGVSIEDIKALYDKLVSAIPKSGQVVPFIKFDNPNKIVKVPKIIGVFTCKGGVGTTTYAACLVEHYNSISEKAVLLDMCNPPNAKYHITGSYVTGDLSNIEELHASYRRIVIDAPITDMNYDMLDAYIWVVDADVIQCIEPSANIIKSLPSKPSAIVYNRQRSEVPAEIIKSLLPAIPIIAVDDDFISCMAALSAQIPASTKSEIIADAVGKISALIDGSGMI